MNVSHLFCLSPAYLLSAEKNAFRGVCVCVNVRVANRSKLLAHVVPIDNEICLSRVSMYVSVDALEQLHFAWCFVSISVIKLVINFVHRFPSGEVSSYL